MMKAADVLSGRPEVQALCAVVATLLDRRYEVVAPPSGSASSLRSKFLALRSKLEKKTGSRTLRVVDGPGQAGDVLLCRHVPEGRRRLLRCLRSDAAPGFAIVAADLDAVQRDAELAELLLRSQSPFFVVPAVPSDGVLFVGGRGLESGGARAKCRAAVIAAARAEKAAGRPFCKLADDVARLKELLSSGTAASKLAHLFSRTPVALRERLQLDDEAAYSVTDERMADRLTAEALGLEGVTRSTLIVDATACVGGNSLSFAKQFDRVVAVERDATRCGMLRHNVAVLASRMRGAVEVVCGDAIEEVPLLAARRGGCGTVGWVAFLDPPWGGLGYKDQAKCELELSGVPLASLLRRFQALPGCRWLLCKVPFNFDAKALRQSAVCGRVRVLSLSKHVKCLVLRGGGGATSKRSGGAVQTAEEREGKRAKKRRMHQVVENSATGSSRTS